MTSMIETTTNAPAPVEIDIVSAVQRVLQNHDEPLTLSKIRTALPGRFKSVTLEELTELLLRQVSASVVYAYPKYRSQQDRFWDRPMPVHIAGLLQSMLQDGPLAWSELRRKMPAYAQTQAEEVLREQLAQGRLFRHPRVGRGGERFGAHPPEPRDYLRTEFVEVFARLEQLGFTSAQLRAGALELLHDDEWAVTKTPAPTPVSEPSSSEPNCTEANAAMTAE